MVLLPDHQIGYALLEQEKTEVTELLIKASVHSVSSCKMGFAIRKKAWAWRMKALYVSAGLSLVGIGDSGNSGPTHFVTELVISLENRQRTQWEGVRL